MFIIIMTSLCHRFKFTNSTNTTKTTYGTFRHQLIIAIILSVLFGLGWAFGLIGTSSLPEEVYVPAQYIFSIFVGLQGVLIFVFHGVRSRDARKEWKRWWYVITGREEHLHVTSTTGTAQRSNTYQSRQRQSTSHADSVQLASITCTETTGEKGEQNKMTEE